MPINAPQDLKTRKSLFIALLALIVIVIAYTVFQENKPWVIPEEAKNRKNPVPPSEAATIAAKPLYKENCAQCHGDTGKGDGSEALRYDPKPADFTDAPHMNTVTDGALFYQISQGRKPMPSFKRRMTEGQRWQLVLLIRSFAAPATKQPDSTTTKPEASKPPAASLTK